ncbi:hypothetical protein EIP91_005654 [Steccherinum ochraceum]|uniref:DUF6535 domain-containing protein n=1 Tax=Steccherinum ochraceum TaxID=92696 RepID=A0A4R0RCY5_9APHY|nr:hypothetical protein EIP91_005654 [Steccherinum ochraceum]
MVDTESGRPEYVVSYTRRVRHRQSSGTLYSNATGFAPVFERDGDEGSCKSGCSSHNQEAKETLSMPDRWSACSQAIKHFDEVTVKGWKEDIDSLLVFAGLFSAVITAFIVDNYKQLQPDPAQLTVQLLQQISLQLAPGSAALNVTDQNLLQSNAAPTSHAIRINTVWLIALVFSMISALIGIVAKQWLREYLTGMSTSPRESVRLRQYRHDGLVRWHVAEIIAFLPLLLQIALVLFIHGLLELLWTLDKTVAGIVTALTAVCLSFYLATIVVPAFSTNNPFKSPQSWAFAVCMWRLARYCTKIYLAPNPGIIGAENIGAYDAIPGSWRDREVKFMRLTGDELDQRALARAYKHSLDEEFLDVVFPCANDLTPETAISFAVDVLTRRAECSENVLMDSIRSKGPRLVIEKFILRAGDRGTHRLIHMLLDVLPRMLHDVERLKITPLDILFILRKLLTTSELALCEMISHRRALNTLALLIDEQCTEHVQRAALHLLWEMTRLGCNMDYCPEGVVNIVLCARNAHRRHDHDTFVHASGILLARLSAPQSHIHDPRWNGREQAREWIRDIGDYFQDRNELGIQYDPGVRYDSGATMKWCSGLAAVSLKDKDLLGESLVSALEEGARLGLVDCDLQEGDALQHLIALYSDHS